MATGRKTEKTDYGELLRELKGAGPLPLYMLWGEEDYLRESFFEEIKRLCLEGGGEDFNYHRLSGAPLDVQALSEAVDAVPFMGGRSLVEVRGFEVNSCRDEAAERLKEIVSDIPDCVTVVFILPTDTAPDGRLALPKYLKKQARAIEFTTQSHKLLINWIGKRFAARGKNIGTSECERLIFLSGERMTGLVQEIEKIAAYEKSGEISAETIDKVAHHIPEARVFEMTDAIAARKFDDAAQALAELMQTGEHPIKTLAMIGMQMRRLYAARLALDRDLGRDYVMDVCGIKYPYHADSLMRSARGFTPDQLRYAVSLCAEADYRMKSSSEDDREVLKDLFLRIAAGGTL